MDSTKIAQWYLRVARQLTESGMPVLAEGQVEKGGSTAEWLGIGIMASLHSQWQKNRGGFLETQLHADIKCQLITSNLFFMIMHQIGSKINGNAVLAIQKVPTLLCTSQGLVIADRSHPVIIIALWKHTTGI